ncbi:hypothetical protein WEI85_19375 [Actinomycetes bacterium KLBMP 9797]
MSEVALASLRELAGSELYRRNAFRVTGLPADADRRTARHRQQRLAAALQVGAEVDGDGSAVRLEDLPAAFDVVLGDPRRRLVHEVFAVWGPPAGCRCSPGLHRDHDIAVRAHAEALDATLAALTGTGPVDRADPDRVPDGWSTAAAAWTKTLRSAAFWRHLHHRVKALDDRQLDASIVDVLRAELPGVLVRPLLTLAASVPHPAPLRKRLDGWPVSAKQLDRLVEEIAEPAYAEFDAIVDDLHRRLESGDVDGTLREMRDRAKPVLARITGLAPSKRHRRTAAARDRAAVLLNNCALARHRATRRYDRRVRAWLREAEKLATEPENLRRIRENHEGFEALEEFRAKVEEIELTQGSRTARLFLRSILGQVTNEPLADAIRDMLTELEAGTPIGYARRVAGPVWQAATGGRRRRVAAVAIVCVVLALAYVLHQSGDGGPDAGRGHQHEVVWR